MSDFHQQAYAIYCSYGQWFAAIRIPPEEENGGAFIWSLQELGKCVSQEEALEKASQCLRALEQKPSE